MSFTAPNSRVRRRDGDDAEQSADASQPRVVDQSAVAADVMSQRTSAAAPVGSPAAQPQPSAEVQPLPEQFRKRPRQSPRFCSPLDQLATVELQLCLQFLDTKSKLKAARCSRRLLQAVDHPMAWKGPSVAVSSFNRTQLSSLIRQSLLRHAPLALELVRLSKLPAAEVAGILHVRELAIHCGIQVDLVLQLLTPPALQGLQTLRVGSQLQESTLRLLASLPTLHTLQYWQMDEPADWRWLPAMPALTDLTLTNLLSQYFPQPAVDAIGQCARLQSLRLRGVDFEAGSFARLCATPALRQLRHLELVNSRALREEPTANEFATGFSALAGLESLCLGCVSGVDTFLPPLARAPALRTLIIPCVPDSSFVLRSHGPTSPSRNALISLLTAAPRLAVRLEAPASIEGWRALNVRRRASASAAEREQMDNQWRELRRMAAEMERVTIVDP